MNLNQWMTTQPTRPDFEAQPQLGMNDFAGAGAFNYGGQQASNFPAAQQPVWGPAPDRPEFDREAFRALDDPAARHAFRSDWRDARREWRGDMRDWRQQFPGQMAPQNSGYANIGDMMQRFPEQGMRNMRTPMGWNSQPGL